MNKIKELMSKERTRNIILAFIVGFIGVIVIGTGISYGSIMWLKNGEEVDYLSDQQVGDLTFKIVDTI